MNKKKEFNYIINKKLMQIRISLYTLDLVFEDDIIITSGYRLKYIEEGNTVFEWQNSEKPLFSINNLLDIPIQKVFIDKSSNLILEFFNKCTLLIMADQSEGESYMIFNHHDFDSFP
jgi:hypothetical protein